MSFVCSCMGSEYYADCLDSWIWSVELEVDSN